MGKRLSSAVLLAALVAALPAGTALAGALKPDGRHASYAPEAERGTQATGPESPDQTPLGLQDPERLRREKAGAGRDRFGPLPGDLGDGPLADTDVSVLAGLNQPGLGPGSTSPPDTTGAAGPSHYVELVNRSIAVYRKSDLAQVGATVALRDFTQHPTGLENLFDPQVIWDPQTNRWYYAMDRRVGPTGSQVAHLAYGWSRTADPTDLAGGWCHQNIETGPNLDDYPKLGDNDSHLIIGTNLFPANGDGSLITSRVWTIPKPAAGDTACPSTVSGIQTFGAPGAPLRTADGATVFTPVAANTIDSSANGYVVSRNGSANLMTWHVTPAGALVPDGNIGIATALAPADVPQPDVGCAAACDRLDSLDGRLTQAVSARDPDAGDAQAVWTQHSIADPAGSGRSVLRWYELLPGACTGGGCPASARRQQGEVKDAVHHVFNGAISPATNGNEAAVDYNVGSETLAAEIRARSRLSGTALGAMGAETTLGTSDASLDDHTCGTRDTRPACRWGDYAGATPDPASPRVVWGSNQSIGPVTPGSPHWRTRNFALQTALTPYAAFTLSPSPAAPGQSVTFDAAASSDPGGTIVRYEWDLDGDGNFETDTGAQPTVSRPYATPGTVTVRLRVTDNGGATGETSRPLRINVPPTASFTATPNPVQTGGTVNFDAGASADPDGTIARYQWDLDGDGSFETDTGTSPTAPRAYAAPGTLTIRLRVTDNSGATAEATRALRINAAPAPVLRVAPSPAAAGQRVSFDGSASSDPDGTIARYEWDLDGNGTFETDTGAVPSASRSYGAPATTTVRLRVTDDDGAARATSRALTIRPKSVNPSPATPTARSFSGCAAATASLRLGTDGADSITGTAAGERIFASLGSDRVAGLAGDDCIDLGPGTDRGDGGRGDDLVLGGSGRDRIGGAAGRDRLRGGTAGDRVGGAAGNDDIRGDSGADRLSGGSGRDRLSGGSGADRLSGGAGGDRLSGGSGPDRLSGGAGDDRVSARDRRRDRVRCGRGRDAVLADRLDRVARDCERVRRAR